MKYVYILKDYTGSRYFSTLEKAKAEGLTVASYVIEDWTPWNREEDFWTMRFRGVDDVQHMSTIKKQRVID